MERVDRLVSGPWSFWRGLSILVAFVVLFTMLNAAHLLWVRQSVGFEAYLGDTGRMPPGLLLVGQTIKALSIVAVICALALRGHRLGWSALGFRPTRAIWIAAAVALAIVGLALRLVLAKTMVVALPDWGRSFVAPPFYWGDATAPTMIALLGMTMLVTPVVEEVFFRGFMFQWMATHRPLWLAVLASSVIFGVSHIVPPQIISAAVMSLIITLLFILSRSIWPAIVCHVVNNSVSVMLGLAAVQKLLPDFLTPPGV
jgi:uncharacterized protein